MAPDGQIANQKGDPLDLGTLINSTPGLIHTGQPDGYLDFFNHSWLRYVGKPLDHLLGWKWTAFIHPDDVEGIVERWRASLTSGEPFLYETRVLRADGQYRWMLHHKVALRDEQGRILKWYGSSIDIEDRKQAEEALRSSEAYLAEAQRLSHTGSFGWRPDSGEIVWSDETYRNFEYPCSVTPTIDLIVQRVHPGDRAGFQEVINQASATRTDFEHTYRLLLTDGRIKHVHAIAHATRDKSGRLEYIGAIQDVTRHRLAEDQLKAAAEELQASERDLRSVIHTIPTMIWSAAPDGSVDFFNPRWLDYTGLSPVQSQGWGWTAAIHPDDMRLLTDAWRSILIHGEPGEIEARVRRFDGTYRWFLFRANPLRDELGNIVKWYGINLDIEDRKRAEEALRSSEAYLTEAQRLSHTGTFGWRPDSGEIVWTDETYRIFEYARAEKPTLNMVLQRVHPEDRALAQQIIHRASQTGIDFEHEYRLLLPDGRVKHVHALSHVGQDASGNREFVGAVTDITERKATEDKIRRLVEAGILGIFFANVDGSIVEANQAFLQMLQYDRQDLVSGRLRWADLTPEEWRERDERSLKEFLETGVFHYEKEYFRKDGSRVPVLVGGARLQNPNEGVVYVLDLTEQKRAQEALRKSEAYLAEAQRLSRTGSWAWSPDSDVRHWSEECYRVLGFDPRDGLPRTEELIQRIHPDDQPAFRESTRRAVQKMSHEEVDYRIVHPGGAVRDIHSIGHPVFSPSGDLIEFTGTVIDITDRKVAEAKIREQEMELRQMLDFTPQLIAVYGSNRERLYANRFALDYLGMSLDEWRQRSFGAEIHPDDLQPVRSYWERALSNGSTHESEVRFRKCDGSFRWFLVRFNPLHDDKGQVTRWYIACTDIDDRKRAEEKLLLENAALREEIDQTSMFEEIVGTSAALQTLLSRVSKVAPSDSTVLITGETGTGKELVARAIHRRSQRSGRAFISVNCAAIPRDLIASELFGHEKGAFTGAMQRRLGRFEMADRGTIFLDEVGELSPDTQVALLRVLQEREFERVGGGQPIRVDVRIIAATNRDLPVAVANGTFRQDLFYRLNVFPIEVPPLRERKEDILMLVEYFAQRYASRAGKNIHSIEKKTLRLLQSYQWPGNIRELQNVIERSVILSSGEVLSVDESWLCREDPQPLSRTEAPTSLKGGFEPRSEREIIEAALAESRGRVSGPSGAAAKLGIPPSTLDHRIKALNIAKQQFKFR